MGARRSLAQFALVIAAAVAAPADSGELIPVKNTTALGVTPSPAASPSAEAVSDNNEPRELGGEGRGREGREGGDSEATACARPAPCARVRRGMAVAGRT